MGYYQAPYLHEADYPVPIAFPAVEPLEEAPEEVDPHVDGELDKLGLEAE
jgi:hypothetical protein